MLENEKVLNEIDDEELNEVAGGGTYRKDGYLKTTVGYCCEEYECRNCGSRREHLCKSGEVPITRSCGTCKWHTILRCGNPINKR